MESKKRGLNELRQEKEFGYKQPITHLKVARERVMMDLNRLQTIYDNIQHFAKQNPNDYDLGRVVRTYLIEQGLYD